MKKGLLKAAFADAVFAPADCIVMCANKIAGKENGPAMSGIMVMSAALGLSIVSNVTSMGNADPETLAIALTALEMPNYAAGGLSGQMFPRTRAVMHEDIKESVKPLEPSP